MKISEMTNDQAAEALIRLTVPFSNICDDEDAMKMIDEYQAMNKQPLIKTIGKMLPQLAAYLFKSHKTDLYEIVGAVTFKKSAEVAKMNFLETIKVLRESYDEVMRSFFTSSVQQMKQPVGKRSVSSSSMDTTE